MAQGKRTKIAAIIILVEAIILVVGGLGTYGYTYLVLGGPCARTSSCAPGVPCSLPEFCLTNIALDLANWSLGIGLIMLLAAILLFMKNRAMWVIVALMFLLIVGWFIMMALVMSHIYVFLWSLPIVIPLLILLSDIKNVLKKT